MSNEEPLSVQLSAKITPTLRELLDTASARFGPTDGKLVRMALESFLPSYLAAAGRSENIEFLATVGAAVEANPEIKPDLEKFLRNRIRKSRTAA